MGVNKQLAPMDNVGFAPFLKPVHFRGFTLSYAVVVCSIAVVLPFLRYCLEKLVYEPLGRALMPPSKEKVEDEKVKNGAISPVAMMKWKESSWMLTFYATTTTIAFLTAIREPWFTSTAHFWLGCTRLPCDKDIPQGVMLLYCVGAGFYLQGIPSLFLWQTKKKDFWTMLAHHIVTLFLFAYSFYVNFTSVGCMIMLLHDVCDVWMEAAKLAIRMKNELLTNMLFGIFLVVWVSARLVYFPFVIIRSCLWEPIEIIGIPYGIEPEPHYSVFNSLLAMLLVFHIYWTYLIGKVVQRAVSKKVEDVREDDSDDD